jgi:ketosteroid isomerase-like protein
LEPLTSVGTVSRRQIRGISGRAFGHGLLLIAFLAFASVTSAVGPAEDAEQVVVRFHAALAAGDRTAALALLAADAIVIENGKLESRAEYAAGHLAADIDFARQVRVERTNARTVVEGRIAWVSSVSTSTGEFKGRPVKLVNAELMVLALHQRRWLIRAIHWSSLP